MLLSVQIWQTDPIRFVAYGVLGGTCALAANRTAGRHAQVLAGMAVVSFLLGLALWLNVAGEIADLGRRAAGSEGWYGDRRPVQAVVIVIIVGVMAVLAARVWFYASSRTLVPQVPLLMFMSLLGYVAVRAISLHQIDAYLSPRLVHDIRVGDVIELIWVLTVAVAVLAASMSQGSGNGPRAR